MYLIKMTVIRLSSKTIQWIASTCSSIVEIFERSGGGFNFCSLPNRLEFRSPLIHSCTGRGVFSEYQYQIAIDIIECHTFLFRMLYDCFDLLFRPFLYYFSQLSTLYGFRLQKHEDGRSGCVLSQQKCSAMAFLSRRSLKLFRWILQGPILVIPYRVRVELIVRRTRVYSTQLKALELKYHK